MDTRKPGMLYSIMLIAVFLVAWLYVPIKEYWVKSCQDKKYGFSYNGKRKSLGIPAIPGRWHIKERKSDFIWWTGDEKVIGHKRKSVAFSGATLLKNMMYTRFRYKTETEDGFKLNIITVLNHIKIR